MITLVLVDDHPAVVAGVRAWCAGAEPPMKVLDAGPNVSVAWLEPGNSADVVVFDLQLDVAGPAWGDLKRLVDAGRRVVVYSMRADSEAVLTCLDLGAFTYLTKAEGEEHLVAAVRAAAADAPYTSPSMSGAFATDGNANRPQLSPRETEVLLEWFHSESKEMVAARLNITVSRVNSCLERIRIKYANAGREAPTKAALVARALQDGLVAIDDL